MIWDIAVPFDKEEYMAQIYPLPILVSYSRFLEALYSICIIAEVHLESALFFLPKRL